MKYFICILFFFSFSDLDSQNFKEFSKDSEQFFSELNDMFSKISVKEQKDLCEEMMVKFIQFWNTGVFDKEVKETIKETCNRLLSRRMKAYPDFYNYLSVMNGLKEYYHPDNSYLAWVKCLDLVLDDRRSSKPLMSFLETSNQLLYESVLYRSKATEWKSSSMDFVFAFDSIPKVLFEKLNLVCYSNNDSAVIYETKGEFYPLQSAWKGQTGKVNWVRAGFSENDVFANLNKYEINLAFSKYTADSVKFYHKNYWSRPLMGTLEEKVLANVTTENASYPQFRSYRMNIEIKEVFKDIDFAGGIEMHGIKLFGLGDQNLDAYLSFKKDNKEFIKIHSKNIVIYPDRLASAVASATIICEEDSIHHPGLQLNYVDGIKELSLARTGEGTSKSPFYDSYHNLDIYSEAIYWKMGEPTIDFERVKGTGSGKASFESSSYFSEARYLKLQGIDLMNPLNVIQRYTNKYNVREVGVQALSEEILMPQEQVIAMLVNLSNRGFVIYDRDRKTAVVKEKLYDYINAMNRKVDYDVLQFNSETFRMQNASLELDSFGLKLFGVPFVFLSDSQNVFIYPQNEQLIVKKGMDFNFSGRVHAGKFDFYARQCEFDYDQFKIGMPVIDSMSFIVNSFETNESGEHYPVKVKNVVSDLGGDLYIDDPNNKSGLKPFPNFPIFNSTKDAYVYYDKRSLFNGIYNREKFYFYVYPFTIDSLDNFKTELLQFNGYLASAGIFPDIEDTLRVQSDYSLGLIAKTPPGGYPVYGGKGTYLADITLNDKGLRGKGSIEYLTSTSWSDDYIFFPDSCNSVVREFVIAEQFTPLEYPAVTGENAKLHWIPYKDKMIFRQWEVPFNMFNQQSYLLGTLVLTPKELRGAGTMSFEDAQLQSKMYIFGQHEISADSADFDLKSTDLAASAFSTKNYKSHIDFDERKGEFASNGGASFVEFPVNQYICSIDEFDWFMDSYQIAIGSAEKEAEMARFDNLTIRELIDIPLEGSEFISVHPDQDSLSFISTIATYNLKEFILNAEDVKYIRVADAAIFPTDKRIVINPGAKMNTIPDAKILTNTVTRYHEIYDAVIDIKGKKKYTGIGNYDYVDENADRQKIFLQNLGVDPSFQSVGNGYVSDSSGFTISKDFDFAGNILLYANREFLNFDGAFRIKHTCSSGRRSWVKFNSDINPADIYIKVDENLVSMDRKPLSSGLMYSEEENRFYSGFFNEKRAASDQEILSASGFIKFDKASEVYEVAALNKLKGLTSKGNQLSLDRKKCVLTSQGQFSLGAELGRVKMGVFGTSKYYIIPDSTSFDLVIALDFPFDDKALSMMAENINGKNLMGVNLVRPEYLKALTDILGDKEAEKVISDLRLFGKFRRYPSELEHTFLFTDVKFKWNYATRSFVSYGPIGIGCIGKTQVNKFVDGFIEIERKRTGDVISIYIEFENGKNWYFFNYRNNLMQTFATNTEYNTIIQELKEDKRTVKQDKEGQEYSFIISNLRKKADFLMRVKK